MVTDPYIRRGPSRRSEMGEHWNSLIDLSFGTHPVVPLFGFSRVSLLVSAGCPFWVQQGFCPRFSRLSVFSLGFSRASLLGSAGPLFGFSRVSLLGSAGCPFWVQQGVSIGFSRVSLLGSAGCPSRIQQAVSLEFFSMFSVGFSRASLFVQLGVPPGVSRVSLLSSAGCPSWVQQASLLGSAGCLS